MKFTKEQLSDSLKAELTKNGKHISISDRTLKEHSDSLYDLVVTEDSELADIMAKILPQFITLNGNYTKDYGDFANKWKAEHPEPKNEPSKNEDENNNEPSAEMQALLDRLSKLEELNAKSELDKVIASKKSELRAKSKELGIKDEKWLNTYISQISVDKDTDIEQKAQSAYEFYNISNAGAGRFTPGGAGGGEGNEKFDEHKWDSVAKLLGADTASK
jgi:hypothetical protein